MPISIRMTEEEKELALAYSKVKGCTLSEAIKRAFFEKIEDEYDVAVADAALKEYERDPQTVSLAKLKEELGL